MPSANAAWRLADEFRRRGLLEADELRRRRYLEQALSAFRRAAEAVTLSDSFLLDTATAAVLMDLQAWWDALDLLPPMGEDRLLAYSGAIEQIVCGHMRFGTQLGLTLMLPSDFDGLRRELTKFVGEFGPPPGGELVFTRMNIGLLVEPVPDVVDRGLRQALLVIAPILDKTYRTKISVRPPERPVGSARYCSSGSTYPIAETIPLSPTPLLTVLLGALVQLLQLKTIWHSLEVWNSSEVDMEVPFEPSDLCHACSPAQSPVEFIFEMLVPPLPVTRALQPYVKALLSRRVRYAQAFEEPLALLMAENIDDANLHEAALCESVGSAISAARAARKSSRRATVTFDVGARVTLRGLRVQYELNGRSGEVVAFNSEGDLYTVAVDGSGPITVTESNLKATLESLRVKNLCMNCGEEPGGKLSKCGRCGLVSYCSKACQAANWAVHKLECGCEVEVYSDMVRDLNESLRNATPEEYTRMLATGLPEHFYTPEMARLNSRVALSQYTPKVLQRMQKMGTRLPKNVVLAEDPAEIDRFIETVTPWLNVRFSIEDASADWRPTLATIKLASDMSLRKQNGGSGTIRILRRTPSTNWFFACGMDGGTELTTRVAKESGLGPKSADVCIYLLWGGKGRVMSTWNELAAMDFVWRVGALQASY